MCILPRGQIIQQRYHALFACTLEAGYEAHVKLGLDSIRCRVRKGTASSLFVSPCVEAHATDAAVHTCMTCLQCRGRKRLPGCGHLSFCSP
eukprot:354470-Chlamydomonas_euryale.AAC.41